MADGSVQQQLSSSGLRDGSNKRSDFTNRVANAHTHPIKAVKTSLSSKQNRGFTLLELLVIVVIFIIMAVLVYPGGATDKARALRVTCLSNLKQIGLAYRVWEGDQRVVFPMEVSETNGGTMEFTSGPNAFHHFQIMSNELSTPKILFCPAETDRNRFVATNWNINNSNISFFVGVDAAETNAQMILSGDHNITNGTPIKNGLLELGTNQLGRLD